VKRRIEILEDRFGDQEEKNDKKEEVVDFVDVCYNILSFQDRQSTIIQLVNLGKDDKA